MWFWQFRGVEKQLLSDYNYAPAIVKLVRDGSPRAFEMRCQALEHHKDSFARAEIVNAFEKSGNRQAVPAILNALKDKDQHVRWRAAHAVGALGDPSAGDALAEVLSDSSEKARSAAVYSLKRIGWQPKNLNETIRFAEATGDYSLISTTAVEAVEPLVQLLRRSKHKAFVVNTLARIGNTRAVEPLIPVLQDSDQSVRKAAAEALRKFGWGKIPQERIALAQAEGNYNAIKAENDKAAVEPLIELLLDTSEDARIAAITALVKLKDTRAIHPLIFLALHEDKQNVSNAVREALVSMGASAVQPLIDALKVSEDGFRKKAAEILGQIGDTRAVEPLIPVLQDSDQSVRKAAAEALRKFGWGKIPQERIALAQAEGNYNAIKAENDKAAVEPLIELLLDTSEDARIAAITALVKLT